MKEFKSFKFDSKICRKELNGLKISFDELYLHLDTILRSYEAAFLADEEKTNSISIITV
jgi:hypothetical protein